MGGHTHTQSLKLKEMGDGRQEIKHNLPKAAEKFLGCPQAPQGEYAEGKCKQKISGDHQEGRGPSYFKMF